MSSKEQDLWSQQLDGITKNQESASSMSQPSTSYPVHTYDAPVLPHGQFPPSVQPYYDAQTNMLYLPDPPVGYNATLKAVEATHPNGQKHTTYAYVYDNVAVPFGQAANQGSNASASYNANQPQGTWTQPQQQFGMQDKNKYQDVSAQPRYSFGMQGQNQYFDPSGQPQQTSGMHGQAQHPGFHLHANAGPRYRPQSSRYRDPMLLTRSQYQDTRDPRHKPRHPAAGSRINPNMPTEDAEYVYYKPVGQPQRAYKVAPTHLNSRDPAVGGMHEFQASRRPTFAKAKNFKGEEEYREYRPAASNRRAAHFNLPPVDRGATTQSARQQSDAELNTGRPPQARIVYAELHPNPDISKLLYSLMIRDEPRFGIPRVSQEVQDELLKNPAKYHAHLQDELYTRALQLQKSAREHGTPFHVDRTLKQHLLHELHEPTFQEHLKLRQRNLDLLNLLEKCGSGLNAIDEPYDFELDGLRAQLAEEARRELAENMVKMTAAVARSYEEQLRDEQEEVYQQMYAHLAVDRVKDVPSPTRGPMRPEVLESPIVLTQGERVNEFTRRIPNPYAPEVLKKEDERLARLRKEYPEDDGFAIFRRSSGMLRRVHLRDAVREDDNDMRPSKMPAHLEVPKDSAVPSRPATFSSAPQGSWGATSQVSPKLRRPSVHGVFSESSDAFDVSGAKKKSLPLRHRPAILFKGTSGGLFDGSLADSVKRADSYTAEEKPSYLKIMPNDWMAEAAKHKKKQLARADSDDEFATPLAMPKAISDRPAYQSYGGGDASDRTPRPGQFDDGSNGMDEKKISPAALLEQWGLNPSKQLGSTSRVIPHVHFKANNTGAIYKSPISGAIKFALAVEDYSSSRNKIPELPDNSNVFWPVTYETREAQYYQKSAGKLFDHLPKGSVLIAAPTVKSLRVEKAAAIANEAAESHKVALKYGLDPDAHVGHDLRKAESNMFGLGTPGKAASDSGYRHHSTFDLKPPIQWHPGYYNTSVTVSPNQIRAPNQTQNNSVHRHDAPYNQPHHGMQQHGHGHGHSVPTSQQGFLQRIPNNGNTHGASHNQAQRFDGAQATHGQQSSEQQHARQQQTYIGPYGNTITSNTIMGLGNGMAWGGWTYQSAGSMSGNAGSTGPMSPRLNPQDPHYPIVGCGSGSGYQNFSYTGPRGPM